MIYFVTDGEYVKIGYTDVDVMARLAGLQTGNARELTVVGTMEGDQAAEALLHNILKDFRVRGEWFALSLDYWEGIEKEKKEYVCPDCENTFGTVQALSAHSRFCEVQPIASANGSAK